MDDELIELDDYDLVIDGHVLYLFCKTESEAVKKAREEAWIAYYQACTRYWNGLVPIQGE